MKKRFIIIEIGIWLIIIASIIGAMIFAYLKFFVEPNSYTIKFIDIDGITQGSPVRFMGLNVGHVRKLKSKDKHIDVDIVITKKNMSIPNGTKARVEFYGLGGSKSIELMPPDTDCEVGILTENTIRLNDITHEVKKFVHILEYIEKYVRSLNAVNMEKFLQEVINYEDDKIKSTGEKMQQTQLQIINKADSINKSQDEVNKKIEKARHNVEKINRFINK